MTSPVIILTICLSGSRHRILQVRLRCHIVSQTAVRSTNTALTFFFFLPKSSPRCLESTKWLDLRCSTGIDLGPPYNIYTYNLPTSVSQKYAYAACRWWTRHGIDKMLEDLDWDTQQKDESITLWIPWRLIWLKDCDN